MSRWDSLKAAEVLAVNLDVGQVDTRMLGVADLEDQRFVGQQRGAGSDVPVVPTPVGRPWVFMLI